jgi:hypothetical protein
MQYALLAVIAFGVAALLAAIGGQQATPTAPKLPENRKGSYRPPPRAAPPLDYEQQFIGALRQSCAAAFAQWWANRRNCPACDAPTWVIAKREHEQRVEVAHPTHGRVGFVSWVQRVSCSTCELQLSFRHDESSLPHLLPTADPLPSPARQFTIRSGPAIAGTVTEAPDGVTSRRTGEGTQLAKAGVSIVETFAAATRGACYPNLDTATCDRLIRRVVCERAALYGITAEG